MKNNQLECGAWEWLIELLNIRYWRSRSGDLNINLCNRQDLVHESWTLVSLSTSQSHSSVGLAYRSRVIIEKLLHPILILLHGNGCPFRGCALFMAHSFQTMLIFDYYTGKTHMGLNLEHTNTLIDTSTYTAVVFLIPIKSNKIGPS